MRLKRIIMIGTLALVITFDGRLLGDQTAAAAMKNACNLDKREPQPAASPDTQAASDDVFLSLLGAANERDVYDALYEGRSLADIAAAGGKDVRPLIRHQIAELTDQLDARLAGGSITPEQYRALRAELPDIVARSAYGRDAQPNASG